MSQRLTEPTKATRAYLVKQNALHEQLRAENDNSFVSIGTLARRILITARNLSARVR